MMDNYWYGHTDRISPEAPVPVVTIDRKESRPGGAANVAMNCKALGASVYLLTVVGKDKEGNELINQLNQYGIHTDFCQQSKTRTTTGKTRLLARNQQIVRIDEEDSSELNTKDEHSFIDMCLRAIQIEAPDILIFEDYNKGVLKANVIQKIITHCKHVGVLTSVDPKLSHFFSYSGVDIFKPNLKEVKEAFSIDTIALNTASLKKIHQQLYDKLKHNITLITLSEHGVYVSDSHKSHLIPAHKRDIADVSGAGDTVISVASMVYVSSLDPYLMAYISNLAGGLVCESVGVVTIQKNQLLKECLHRLGK